MTSTITDRLNGVATSVAVKVPCRAATTGPITLFGLQTVDGVVLAARDRVLVKDQASASDNGIYLALSGDWLRATDFDGTYDAIGGTQVFVHSGAANSNSYWRVDGSTAVTVGTDDIEFSPAYIDDSASAAFLQGGAWARARTVQDKLRDTFSVKDYGAIGDGESHPLIEGYSTLAAAQVDYPHAVALTDELDWAAAQAAHTALATQQIDGITDHKLSRGAVFYPDGNYLWNRNVKAKGFQGIEGVGTAYTGGSVIHQLTAGTDIFTFYGSENDNTSLGVVVEGLNFEFDSALGSVTGYALNFPKFDDIATSQVLASNSHYIRNNRIGGWHPKGRFIKMINCNDVEISGNIVDVCETTAIELGNASDAAVKCTDVRIFGNGFYYTQNPIALRHVHGVTIDNNAFFESFAADWVQIDLGNGGGTVNAGRVEGVSIDGNEFGNVHTALRFDGSVGVITVNGNIMRGCLDYPVVTTGATDVSGVIFTDNNIKVASGYTRDSWINPLSAKFKESTFADNRVDANGVAALTGMVNEISGGSGFGDGMTLRNNPIFNNASPDFGCFQFLPCTARELAIENIQVTASAYPTTDEVFTFSTIAVSDSLTFDLDYEVVVDKTSSNTSTRTGRVRVSLLRLGASIASDVTSISSVAQDLAGVGGATLPTVTFAVGASILTVTVTSDIVAPTTVTVRTRAHSFRASGAVLIKSAT